MQVFVFLLKIVTFSSCVRTQGYKIFTRRSKLKENKVAEIHRNLYRNPQLIDEVSQHKGDYFQGKCKQMPKPHITDFICCCSVCVCICLNAWHSQLGNLGYGLHCLP